MTFIHFGEMAGPTDGLDPSGVDRVMFSRLWPTLREELHEQFARPAGGRPDAPPVPPSARRSGDV